MSLLDRVKLAKLTIKVYNSEKRTEEFLVGSPFEFMFNPATFSESYDTQFGTRQAINSSDAKARFARNLPRTVNVKLILDDTGVHEMGILKLKKQVSVKERINEFLQLTYHMDGKIHEPNYLVLEWGGLLKNGFDCRLQNVKINYTSFNRDGSPLRAELDLTLFSDQDIVKRLAKENKTSPDLTYSRIVKGGDTLPLLCKQIYGKSVYYLRVAQANKLDDFRTLTPGQTLFFPPLET